MIEDVGPSVSSVSQDKLRIIWPEISRDDSAQQHESEYSLTWLLEALRNPTSPTKDPFDEQFPVTSWKGPELSKQDITFDFEAYMKGDDMFKKVMCALNKYGICFLSGVTNDHNSVTQVATRIGPIYDTFYGTDWDVKNDPRASNIAYTSLDLGFHMDLL